MSPLARRCAWVLLALLTSSRAAIGGELKRQGAGELPASDANPYYPHRDSPRLTTPMWVGEPGVEAVVVLAIDDMRDPAEYESVSPADPEPAQGDRRPRRASAS